MTCTVKTQWRPALGHYVWLNSTLLCPHFQAYLRSKFQIRGGIHIKFFWFLPKNVMLWVLIRSAFLCFWCIPRCFWGGIRKLSKHFDWGKKTLSAAMWLSSFRFCKVLILCMWTARIVLLCRVILFFTAWASNWRSGGCGFDPRRVSNILSWRLLMKYFLCSFFPFHWFKKGSCQFLVKECAQYWLTA